MILNTSPRNISWRRTGISATFPTAKTAKKCLLIFYSLLMDVIDDLLLIGLLSFEQFYYPPISFVAL
ncbi:MAG: hypothetical protein M1472_04680, partial [Planctomycetes bacterium]|nr:hypothetical protein [Planctomycetota bacterium]